jgi:hypothetical protein
MVLNVQEFVENVSGRVLNREADLQNVLENVLNREADPPAVLDRARNVLEKRWSVLEILQNVLGFVSNVQVRGHTVQAPDRADEWKSHPVGPRRQNVRVEPQNERAAPQDTLGRGQTDEHLRARRATM